MSTTGKVGDGGPAFPCVDVRHVPSGYGHGEHCEIDQVHGMTLRDYFASAALPSVIAAYLAANGNGCATDHALRNVPVLAYKYADEMLKARG